jgi:hypothetical protein
MRIFKQGDKPATGTESSTAAGDNFFDRLLRRQQSRKSDLRNPFTGVRAVGAPVLLISSFDAHRFPRGGIIVTSTHFSCGVSHDSRSE